MDTALIATVTLFVLGSLMLIFVVWHTCFSRDRIDPERERIRTTKI